MNVFVIHGSHHLTDYAFNGDGLVAWGFINELARRGHRLHVVTDKLDVKANVPENLTLVEFPRRYANAALHYIDYMLRVRAYFDRLSATERFDVAHQLNPVVRGLSLSLLGKKIPIVLGTYVGDWVRLRSAPNYRPLTVSAKAARAVKSVIDGVQQHFASALVLATPHARDRVAFKFDTDDRIELLHHGVDTSLYHPQTLPFDPAPCRHRIVYVGAIQYNKGAFTLADALPRIARSVPDVSLVMVGRGKFVEEMQRRLATLGVAERVTFAGLATRIEVAGWIRSSDVLCAPSFGEPYGQNVLEAMACGKPVVLTTEGGHKYLGGPEGSLAVEPGNPEALADALVAVLSDAERAAAMGRWNRRIAEERHSWENVTTGLERIYERAVLGRTLSGSGKGRQNCKI